MLQTLEEIAGGDLAGFRVLIRQHRRRSTAADLGALVPEVSLKGLGPRARRARALGPRARCASSRRTEAPTSDPSDSEGSRAPRVRDVRSAFHGHGVNCMSVCISTTFDRREYGCPHLLIEARRSFPLSVWIP